MIMIDEIAAWLGIKRLAMLAALAGALISLKFVPDVQTRLGRAFCVAQSFAAAVFGGPAISAQFGATEVAQIGVMLATGALFMSLLNTIVRGISELNVAEIVTSWVKKSRGGS